MSTVLITGANRGIGLEFTQQYLKDGWQVIACCRNPESAAALTALAASHQDQLTITPCDVTKRKHLAALAASFSDMAIDLLINNAGVYKKSSNRLGELEVEDWLDTFRVNSISPIKVTEALLPALLNGAQKKVVMISSKMGSVGDNDSGGAYAYRSSKSALNAATRSLAWDLKKQGVIVVTMHPGWVQTDMGGANALITTEASVTAMRQFFSQMSEAHTGGFYERDGATIAW